jgi:hypothetical protein
MNRGFFLRKLTLLLALGACEAPVTSVVPNGGNTVEGQSGSSAPLPELGGGSADDRISALESFVTQFQTETDARINQLQQTNSALQQNNNQISQSNAALTQTVNSLQTSVNNAIAQASSVSTTAGNAVCAAFLGTPSGSGANFQCAIPPRSISVIHNEANLFTCVPGAPGCDIWPIDLNDGDANRGWADINNPTKFGTGSCNNRTCGTRNVPASRVQVLSINNSLSCKYIELRVTMAAQSYSIGGNHAFASAKVSQNDGGLRFANNAQPAGERPISWKPNENREGRMILNPSEPDEVHIYHRGGYGDDERYKLQSRSFFVTPTPGQATTQFRFEVSYSMYAITKLEATTLCYPN